MKEWKESGSGQDWSHKNNHLGKGQAWGESRWEVVQLWLGITVTQEHHDWAVEKATRDKKGMKKGRDTESSLGEFVGGEMHGI